MGRVLRVYVSGPYTNGDVVVNVRNALIVADDLCRKGFTPFVPHLTHFWHLVEPRNYDEWIRYDLEWLPVCDALFRLPGASNGADMEVAYAQANGIPVFETMDGICTWAQTHFLDTPVRSPDNSSS